MATRITMDQRHTIVVVPITSFLLLQSRFLAASMQSIWLISAWAMTW